MHCMRTPLAQGLFFAVFWTAGMLWWSHPLKPAPTVILILCGILAGVAFGWTMGKVFAWMERRGS